MKKVLITLVALCALYSCKKSDNNTLSVPKTGTVYIIDTAIYFDNNHQYNISPDRYFIDASTNKYYPSSKNVWTYLGGTRYKFEIPDTVSTMGYETVYGADSTGAYSVTTGTAMQYVKYIKIVNGDTIRTF